MPENRGCWSVIACFVGGHRRDFTVMAGLVPAIYVFAATSKTWITGTSPVMTGI
jgi:hypothetical protein